MRFTKKPATKEGWYWLKNGMDFEIGLSIDPEEQLWSLATDDGILDWQELLSRGFRRNINQIEAPK